MKTLIKKNILEQYKVYILYISICIIAIFIAKHKDIFGASETFSTGLIVGIAFSYLNLSLTFDIKKDLNVLIYPVKREDVIRAKFIMFFVGAAIFFGLIVTIISLNAKASEIIKYVIVTICFNYSLMSLLLPLNIKLDGALKGFGIAILIILQVGIIQLIFYYKDTLESIVNNHLYIPIIVIILIFAFSYNLSITLVKRKEL